jgi:hypothetical protein
MSEVTTEFACPSGGRGDAVEQYLAGRLASSEAEAFEAHFFACPECREDVWRVSEVRGALGRPPFAASAASKRRSRFWLTLVAAAAIAFVVLGTWPLLRRGPVETPPSSLRSAHRPLEVGIGAGPRGGFALTWEPVPYASGYDVVVFGSDGTTLWKGESPEPRVVIGPEQLEKAAAGGEPMVQVEAFDVMRQVVARSAPTRLRTKGRRQ